MGKINGGIFKEIINNRFLLVLLDEAEYFDKIVEMIKSVERTKTKICYVCLSKPYLDVIEDMEKVGINTDDFHFIDVLSSHYGAPELRNNCTFVSSPADLDEIQSAITSAISEKNCSVLIFDTISTLLIYQQTHSIIRFANTLISEKKQENAKKLFIILKGGHESGSEIDVLERDLEMFADKKLDFTTMDEH